MRSKLYVQELESRDMQSAIVGLSQGLLSVTADRFGASATVSQLADVVQVLADGQSFSFAAAQVTSILFQGRRGDDSFVNATAIPSLQLAGNGSGRDYLEGGTGNDTLIGSRASGSDTFLFDRGGQSNVLIGGQGSNNIQAFGVNDQIFAGPQFNFIYDIIGGGTVNARQGYGTIFTNATSTVAANSQFSVTTFFQPALAAQAIVLQKDVNGNGIVYLNPQAPGATFTVDQVGSRLFVTYTDASGSQSAVFNVSQVAWFASFGSAGNDTYVYNTSVNAVTYGAGGDDTIIGGRGQNLLKGSSGNDTLVGRGRYNDLSANAGVDTLTTVGGGFTVNRSPAATTFTGSAGPRFAGRSP